MITQVNKQIHSMQVEPNPSLQSCFHHKWSFLSLQLYSAFVLSTTFLLHSLHLVCFLQLLFMVLLSSYLDVLVYKQCDVFVGRKVHIHLSFRTNPFSFLDKLKWMASCTRRMESVICLLGRKPPWFSDIKEGRRGLSLEAKILDIIL